MISAISNSTSQVSSSGISSSGVSSAGNAVQRVEKPSQLPVDRLPEDQVNLSPEAMQLAAVRVVSNNPLPVAAVSENNQVDKPAARVDSTQQQQESVGVYRESGSITSASNDPQPSPVAIAATARPPQPDESASAVNLARQAQQALETYRNASNSAQEQQQKASSINEVI